MFWFPLESNSCMVTEERKPQLVGVSFLNGNAPNSAQYLELLSYCKSLENQNSSLKIELETLKTDATKNQVRRIKRREQRELVKNFHCPFSNCKKQYASELAMNLHMKLKHNAGSKRERICAINRIIKAQKQGREAPKININLPPLQLEVPQLLMQTLKNGQKSPDQPKMMIGN